MHSACFDVGPRLAPSALCDHLSIKAMSALTLYIVYIDIFVMNLEMTIFVTYNC